MDARCNRYIHTTIKQLIMSQTKTVRTGLIKVLKRHEVSYKRFQEMTRKNYFAKTQKNNLIYLDGFIAKYK